MDPNVWVVAIAAIIVAAISIIFSSLSYSRLSYKKQSVKRYEFRPSLWSLGLGLFCSSISLAFFWTAFSYEPVDVSSYVWVWVLFGGIGFIWLILCISWFLKVKSSYLLITNEIVELKYGRRVNSIDLSDVHRVEQVGFYVWIFTSNKKPKMKIPMIFNDSHDILGILRQRIGNEILSGSVPTNRHS